MTKCVISQSMYFPWVGLLEQIRLADIFIHYDDVHFSRGFYHRVQIKSPNGRKWLTLPARNTKTCQNIDEIKLDQAVDWRSNQRAILRHYYLKAPYLKDMLDLVDEVFALPVESLAQLTQASIYALANYFGIAKNVKFLNSKDLNVSGKGSQRLRDLCLEVDAVVYITGHGALNYLDYQIFESSGIDVQFMNYKLVEYPQLFGTFTPYVSGLDLVANCGKHGKEFICSSSVHWKTFLEMRSKNEI